MTAQAFDEETALQAAKALAEVLKQRTHQRKYLGEMVTVQGKLGEALGLPQILSRLQSKVARRRSQGAEQFNELWVTLSQDTRVKVQHLIGWYEPDDLSWDDKRSNRRPD